MRRRLQNMIRVPQFAYLYNTIQCIILVYRNHIKCNSFCFLLSCQKVSKCIVVFGVLCLMVFKIFLSLSRKGLEKRSIMNDTGKDESVFLRNIENILTNGKTQAEITIERFKKNINLDFLYDKKE